MVKKIKHTLSSGNVFADLGLANAAEHLAKAQEAVKIARLLELSKLRRGQKVRAGTRPRRRTKRA